MTDREAKIQRIRKVLERSGAESLALTAGENLAWFFDGARVNVPYGGPAVFSAVVHLDGRVVVWALANEADRLAAEELGDGVDIRPVPWFEPLPATGELLDADAVEELRAARAALLPDERTRYAALGSDVAATVTRVLASARQEESEQQLAGRLAAAVIGIGAEPVVLLVAGEGRLRHRHPVPTAAPLGSRAMVAVGARRSGLIANLTRWIAAPGAPADPRQSALFEVEADAFAATRPGRPLNDVLADIAASYDRHGLGSDAWLGHHQGGPTGYLGRDPKASPATDCLVVSGQAFAWNPSLPGAKVEDTVIVDDDGVHVLTADPAWPTADIRGLARPLPLILES